MPTREEYLNLRNKLVLKNDEMALNNLKISYQKEINSTRDLCYINNIGDLIEVLERRAIISENDTFHLEEIAKEILKIPVSDMYNSQILYTNNKKFDVPNSVCENIYSSDDITSRVHNEIISRLGNKWMDFARHLDIPESKIDEIRSLYGNRNDDCTKSVLLYHKNNTISREWKPNLLQALQKARRVDLRNRVEKILDNYM